MCGNGAYRTYYYRRRSVIVSTFAGGPSHGGPKMNRLLMLTAAAALLLTAAPAFAADLIINEEVAPQTYEPEVFDWSGPYVGVNAGVAWGLFQHPLSLNYDCDYENNWEKCYEEQGVVDLLTGSGDVTAGGFVGGVTAGYNYQMDGLVVGIEGDLNGSTV